MRVIGDFSLYSFAAILRFSTSSAHYFRQYCRISGVSDL